MGRTSTTKTFIHENKRIEVTEIENRNLFKVTLYKESWHITKILGKRKAAWFVLRCLQHKNKIQLSIAAKRGRIKCLLAEIEGKLSGIDWIGMRMANGARPIILKAHKLFRQRLIYIESTERENVYNLRLVDPHTTYRSNPVEISAGQVNEAIKTYDHG